MKLRRIIAWLAIALAVGSTAAHAGGLRLANYMSPNHPFEKKVFAVFADRVAELTKGQVTVRVYSGGELGAGPADQYNRVVDGAADIVYGLPGYTASLFPKTLLIELPGVITEANGTQAVLANKDVIADEYRRVKMLGFWTNGENVLYMRDTPVRSLADLVGKKIRVPSRNAGLLLEAWGATPVSMPVTDIYNAMQTGVLDGAFVDGTATFAFKLSEVTKYITTGMDSSISGFFLLMNREAFEELSEEQQAALLQAGAEISPIANAQQLSDVNKGLTEFAATPGKEFIELTPDEARPFNAAAAVMAKAVVAEVEGQGIAARAFVDALAGK